MNMQLTQKETNYLVELVCEAIFYCRSEKNLSRKEQSILFEKLKKI